MWLGQSAVVRWCAWVCVCAWAAQGAGALRVLGVVPFPSKSHHGVMHTLLRGLAQRGHSVTSLEFFPPSDPPHNYTSVLIDADFMQQFKGPSNAFTMHEASYVTRVLRLWSMGTMAADAVLQQPLVQALARGERGAFDVVVVEAFFNEAFVGLAHLFHAPLVQLCPYVGSPWMYEAVGSPAHVAYVPDPLLPFGDRMSFAQRLTNFLFGVFQEVGRELYFLPKQDAVMRRWLSVEGSEPLPPLRQLLSATSLVLVNSHVTVSYPRPITPNLVPVGGMHVRPPRALPKDLDTIISNASHGVIYFSLGSTLQSTQIPQEKLAALLEVFREMKQLVLMKWEADSFPGKPPNVETRKWLPQNDILAHPNVKLFITHGGLLSSFEALYNGIPIVGIPVFGDQELNMERAEMAGYGIQIPYDELSAKTLRNALNKVLIDKRYKENAVLLSRILRDQPETPLERAVWWIEYIARHKGAPHLQSAAKDLTWYQYHLLDVLAVVFGTLLIIAFICARLSLFLYRKLFSKKSVSSPVDKTKKRK